MNTNEVDTDREKVARTFALFSFTLSAALIAANWSTSSSRIEAAQRQCANDKALILQLESAVRANEIVLRENQAALKSVQEALAN